MFKWLVAEFNTLRPLFLILVSAGLAIGSYFIYNLGVQHGLKNFDTPEMIERQLEVEDMELPPTKTFPAVGTPEFFEAVGQPTE